MRRLCLTAGFLLTVQVSHICAAKDSVTKHNIEFARNERRYYLLVPEKAQETTPAPLLMAFHGAGRDGPSILQPWKNLASRQGIIVAAPESAGKQGWAVPEDGPEFIRAVVDRVAGDFSIDRRRVYLFGHSAGASFALMLSIFEPEYFAATAVSAGVLPSHNQFVHLIGSKRKIPVAIWVGDQDPFFPVSEVKNTDDFLTSHGFEVLLEVIKGHTHNYYRISDEINTKAWSFLSSHTLPEEPRWEAHRFAQ
jgi:poly(3-hydroxybutyrate) depolymerase